MLIQDHGQAEHSQAQHGGGGGSTTTGCADFVATCGAYSAVWNCVTMSYYVWDPGSSHSVRSARGYNTLTHLRWAAVGSDSRNTGYRITVFIWILSIG